VANVFVIVELVGDHPHPASLEVLGQARRIATALGATVYAVAPCARPPGYGQDDLIAVLSGHGADKVLLAVSPQHEGPMRWGTHGAAVLVACATMQPLLLLLADTTAARDVAGRLAARLGAAYLGAAAVEVVGDGVALWEVGSERPRRLEGELDFTVVAAITPGRYAPACGDEEAEVELLETPPFPGADFAELRDGAAGEPRARVFGQGEVAEELARALGGVVADGAGGPPVPLAVAIDSVPAEVAPAEVTVALGPQAAACPTADYAVQGDGPTLATALARAVRDR
jgi:hypothetical protein